MWTEAIFLRVTARGRALCALLLILTLLCACTVTEISGEPRPAETEAVTPEPVFSGRWTGLFDIGDEVSRSLGLDLSPWLSAPLLAELRLEVSPDGGCTLTRDDRACAPVLREALVACVRELQEQESGEALAGLALAEALGADPNDLAAALADELLPPPAVTAGRYDAAQDAILWDSGAVSALARQSDAFSLPLPGLGEPVFYPVDTK